MTPAEFKELADRIGLPRKSLAVCLGVSYRAVERYERGDRPIRKNVQNQMKALALLEDHGLLPDAIRWINNRRGGVPIAIPAESHLTPG